MHKLALESPMYFPRCLVDNRVLMFRNLVGQKKKTVTCPKCGIAYSRTAIKDASPQRWNETRKQSLYKIRKDYNDRRILYHQGLGTREIVDYGMGALAGHS